MKKLLLTAAVLAANFPLAQAEDVALLTLRIGRQKEVKQVAIEFYGKDAPLAVENFSKLARKRFYNGLAFHRAFPHILVQTGDPLSRRKDRTRVGTSGPGYTVLPEIHARHIRGAVAAARLPDSINPSRVSNGSQFYVCLTALPAYDGQYTVFGHVLWGLETLDAISTLPVDSNDYPVERVEIKRLQILPREKLPPAPNPSAPVTKSTRRWWQIF